MRNAGGNGGLQLLQSFVNEAAGFGGVELRSIEASGVVNHAGSVKKGRVVKSGLVCRVRELEQVIFIQRAQSGVKREI